MAGVVKVGQRAPDFVLPNESGREIRLGERLADGPVMLVFYPGDFTPVCTRQLRGYRDRYAEFADLGIQILGISDDPVARHEKFCHAESFPFPLLADPTRRVIDLFSGTSLFSGGRARRANYVIARDGRVLYVHIEPIALTHRKAKELLRALYKLKRRGWLPR